MDETILQNGDSHALPSINIEIDWEQYFKNFCDAHGKYPVVYMSEDLLFPDGWRYSAYNYEGPETPPPKDKIFLRSLKEYYWSRRLIIIRNEARGLEHEIRELTNIQRSRNVALPQRVTYKDDDGHTKQTHSPINFRLLTQRLEWLKSDIEKCIEELSKLS